MRLGYHNLMKLTTLAYLEGFYYRPRIDKELLAEHAEGLIGMSGCLKGEVNYYLHRDDPERAMRAASEYQQILGQENFYLEVMRAGFRRTGENHSRNPRTELHARHPDCRHERLSLSAAGRRARTRRAGLHPDREEAVGPEPSENEFERALLPLTGGDGPGVRGHAGCRAPDPRGS